MDTSRIEYIIEIYNDRTKDWEHKGYSFQSLDEAVAKLSQFRHKFINSDYRLVELTSLIKVLDV